MDNDVCFFLTHPSEPAVRLVPFTSNRTEIRNYRRRKTCQMTRDKAATTREIRDLEIGPGENGAE